MWAVSLFPMGKSFVIYKSQLSCSVFLRHKKVCLTRLRSARNKLAHLFVAQSFWKYIYKLSKRVFKTLKYMIEGCCLGALLEILVIFKKCQYPLRISRRIPYNFSHNFSKVAIIPFDVNQQIYQLVAK
jgi:hypothetical protein